MIPHADVFFLPAAGGEQRLCLFHAPSSEFRGAPRSKILYLHPFAEEMNKSRRMAALACRALAEAGHAVLRVHDDGRLRDTDELRHGNGLAGMQERVAALGGRLKLAAGDGLALELQVPLGATP